MPRLKIDTHFQFEVNLLSKYPFLQHLNENWARLSVKVKLKMPVLRPMVLQRQNEVPFPAFADAKMDARQRDAHV